MAHVPAGTVIGAIDGDIETPYALGDSYQVGYWETRLACLKVMSATLWWSGDDLRGLLRPDPSQVRNLVSHARLVFSFRGRTYGELALYQFPP